MNARTKLLFLIPHLGGGGAEHVTALVAGGLADQFEVHVGAVTRSQHRCAGLSSEVRLHCLRAPRVRYGALKLVRLIRRLKPEWIVSGMHNLNFLVLLLRTFYPAGTRVAVRQNASPIGHRICGSLLIARILYTQLYPRADVILCQTEQMAEELKQLAGSEVRIRVIRNPIDISAARKSAEGASLWSGPGPHLLTVSRLSREKGIDLLLAAFQRIQARYPTADLMVFGNGPEKESLQFLKSRLRLSDSVQLAGEVADPTEWFSGAAVFVLPSRSDTMPNALLEAAAGGLPIVTTPANRALVRMLEGQTGVWISEDATVPALQRVLDSALGQIKPGDRFHHSWIAPFEKQAVMAEYTRLFRSELDGVSRP